MTTKVKTKHVPKCTKPEDLTDKIKVNTDLGKWWRQFCFNHISIIPGSFPKRRPFPKRQAEDSGFTAMIRPPYQIYNVEIVDANAKNDFKSRRVDHIVKRIRKSASAAQNGYKEHTNIFKHNTNGAESLQHYREIYAYSRHRLAKINRKRLKKVAQMVKSSGHKEDISKKFQSRRQLDQNRETTKALNSSKTVVSAKVNKPVTAEDVTKSPIPLLRATSQKRDKTLCVKQEETPHSQDENCDRRQCETTQAASKSILDGLPPGTYTKRITFIKSPPSSPLKVTSIDFPDESKVSRKSAPLGRVINQTFTISTKITKTNNEIQGSSNTCEKKDKTVGGLGPQPPLLKRLKVPEQQAPQVFKYTDKMNSLKSRIEIEANDEPLNRMNPPRKSSLVKYTYRDADRREDNAALGRLSEKNRHMFERLTKSPPAKDVIELTQRFLDKYKKK